MKMSEDHATFSDGLTTMALPENSEAMIGERALWKLQKGRLSHRSDFSKEKTHL
jgi:hypothetical protein